MASQNYASLQAKINKEIDKLRKQSTALQSKSRKPVISSIVRSMKEYDISPEEIVAAYGKPIARSTTPAVTKRPKVAKASGPKKTVPPKYRHPETGATWTGRGKAPLWIVEAEKNGKTRQDFLI